MKPHFIIFSLLLLFAASSCTSVKKSASSSTEAPAITSVPEPKKYQAAVTISHNLVHTRLHVSFNWEQQELMGNAYITLTPHFYTTNKLYLDARGMQVNEVNIVRGQSEEELQYEYKNDSIHITLDKFYTRRDTFTVFIDYIARPEALPKGGSAAITSDKGLYFINADGSEPNKPRQIWTQGETQSSSVWFPTIDRPNQKTTQELYITIDTSFVTLSNGKLISSIINQSNGTRTDYWRQTIPHTPYLFMMAIGKYAVVKDQWRNREVSYYVEPEYEPYARQIFGHTPEMLEFFSTILKYEYPWEKYSQVVVRDYVSGAMENTTAVIYGEFVQKDDRTLLDAHNDDIVAHELIHHWFGDLVTCESWSNIALNEAFATYGEYMWAEYKYGRDEADWSLNNDLNAYLREARNKQVNLIRFEYDKQEEVFDRHSYQKGGRILHMLRKYAGDEAFFSALNLYLRQNEYKAAEVHHLRLAFEEVTGEDMNWFFNQWFLDKGHPSLKIEYRYDGENKMQYVTVEQMQSFETTPLYRLPVDIDIYTSEGVKRHRVDIRKQSETFGFPVDEKPYLVNFDAQKMLLCTKTDNHTREEWVAMYRNAPLFLDRHEALSKMVKDYTAGSPEASVVMDALSDPHWSIRSLAIQHCETLASSQKDKLRNKLLSLMSADPNSTVRSEAIIAAGKFFPSDAEVTLQINKAINDRSYRVMKTAINQSLEKNLSQGLELLAGLEMDSNENVKSIVAEFYSKYGSDNQYEFMTRSLQSAQGFSKYAAVQNYGKFLMRCSPDVAVKGLEPVAEIGYRHPQWFVRLSATQVLSEIQKSYGTKEECNRAAATQPGDSILQEREKMLNDTVKKKAESLLADIKARETDTNLLRIYHRY
jgi:aminopeptidase N